MSGLMGFGTARKLTEAVDTAILTLVQDGFLGEVYEGHQTALLSEPSTFDLTDHCGTQEDVNETESDNMRTPLSQIVRSRILHRCGRWSITRRMETWVTARC